MRYPSHAPSAGRRPRSRLQSDCHGTTAIEFALVTPIFIMLLFLVIETAWQLVGDAALHIGVIAASRQVITGSDFADGNRDIAAVESTIISASGGILKLNYLQVTAQAYANPASYPSGQSMPDPLGSSSQLVVYTAQYQQNFLTPLPATILKRFAITYSAKMVAQNEPF